MDEFSMANLTDPSLLVREMEHRVSNEIASVCGAVSLAAARCRDQDARELLDQLKKKLEDYADVQLALQMPEQDAAMDVGQYLSGLCDAVSRSKLDQSSIKLVLGIQPMVLSSERCWLLALIVSELITNAANHAFQGTSGTIRVGLVNNKGVGLCIVSDDGTGARNTIERNGLDIVRALTKSLNGSFSQHLGSQGSAAVVVFPLQANVQRASDIATPTPSG